MISARAQFLSAGHYAPIADAVAEAALIYAAAEGLIVEVGAGTAYYLACVLDRMPNHLGLAVDLSKYAARRAAKAHSRADAIVADVWDRLPVAEESSALTIDVFAPRQPKELHRTLRRDGALVVVTPQVRHLLELREPLGLLSVDEAKQTRVASAFSPFFTLLASRSLVWKLNLTQESAAALAAMGPSARHLDPDILAVRIAALPDPIAVTAAVTIQVYRRT